MMFKSKSKGLVAAALIAALLAIGLFALVGCGGDDSAATTATTTATGPETTTASSTATTAAGSTETTVAAGGGEVVITVPNLKAWNEIDGKVAVTPGEKGKAKGTIVIATAIYSAEAAKIGMDLLKADLEKLGWKAEIRDTGGDVEKLVGVYETAIAEKVDAIVNGYGEVKQIQKGLIDANAVGIPVYGMDSNADPKQLVNVTSDNLGLGTQEASNLAKAIGGKGNVIIFMHDEHPGVAARTRGAMAEFAKNWPDIKIVAKQAIPIPGQIDAARTWMANFLAANPDKGSIAGICSGWDEPAWGAIQSMDQAGRDEIKVAGVDGSPFALKYIKEQGADGPWVGTMKQMWVDIAARLAGVIDAVHNGSTDYFIGTDIQIPGQWIDYAKAQFTTQP